MEPTTEVSERTPLIRAVPNESTSAALADDEVLVATPFEEPLKHDAIYNRFSPTKKKIIVALIAWSGLIPCMFNPLSS